MCITQARSFGLGSLRWEMLESILFSDSQEFYSLSKSSLRHFWHMTVAFYDYQGKHSENVSICFSSNLTVVKKKQLMETFFLYILPHPYRSHNTVHLKIISIFLDSGQSARRGWPNAPGNNTFRITTTSALLIFFSAAYEELFITILQFLYRGRGFQSRSIFIYDRSWFTLVAPK